VTLIVQAPAGFTPTKFAYFQTFNQANATVLAQFFVDAQGALQPLSPPTVPPPAGSAFEIVRHPTKPFVYVGDANAGKVAQFRVAQDGTLQSLNPSTVGPPNSGQFLGNQLAIDPQGRALYTTGNGSASPDIYQFRINADGTLTPFSPATVRPVPPGLPSIGFPRGITVDSAGNNAYTVGNGATVTHLRIQADGSLTPVSTFNLPTVGNLKSVEDVVLTPNGQFAYIVENTQNTITGSAVHQYRVNSDGSLDALTPEFRSIPSAGGFEASIEPGGRFLYIGGGAVLRLPINADGTLGAPVETFPDPNLIGTPHFDPTGTFALSNHFISSGLTMFSVNSDGTLTLVGPVAAAPQRVGFIGFFNR
jgi:6-phosphogluconolactonase (cycloisomerase 2 family)